MDQGKNIYNAFDVVRRTYQDLYKLIEECIKQCEEAGFACLSPNILRYKSDKDIYGWFISQMFLVFRKKGEKNKCLYVIDVNLYDISDDGETPFCFDVPTIELAKFEYPNSSYIKDIYKKNQYYIFWHPLYDDNDNVKDLDGAEEFLELTFPKEISKKVVYNGVERIVCTSFPIIELTRTNMIEKVFGTFKKMEKM